MRTYEREPRSYELMTVLSPDVNEDAIPAVLDRISGYVSAAGGSVVEMLRDSPWGRRRLAYPIRHAGRDVRDGYYTVYHVDLAPSRVDDVERELKLNSDVIRYLLTHYTPKPIDPRALEDAEIAAEDAAAAAYAAAQAEAAASAAPATATIDEPASEPTTEQATEPESEPASTELVATAEETPPSDPPEGETANPGDRAADVADPTSVPQPLDDTAATDGERHGGNGTQTVDEGPGGDAATDREA